MILDLLCARATGSGKDAGPGMVAVIILAVLLVPFALWGAFSRGCAKTKEPTIDEIHVTVIQETLGGAGQVTVVRVSPPVGPWSLTKANSYYYRATVGPNERVVWAEAYVKTGWSITVIVLGGDRPIYGYRFKGERHVLGKTFYPSIDQ